MKTIQRITRWGHPIKTDFLKTRRDTASRWPQCRNCHASLRCTFSSVLRSAPQLTRRTYVAQFRERLSIHREGARITALETTANVAKTTPPMAKASSRCHSGRLDTIGSPLRRMASKDTSRTTVLLQVSDSISLNIALQIGEVTIGTKVNTVEQGIRTADADQGTVIGIRQLEDLLGMPPLTQSDLAHDTEPTSPRPY